MSDVPAEKIPQKEKKKPSSIDQGEESKEKQLKKMEFMDHQRLEKQMEILRSGENQKTLSLASEVRDILVKMGKIEEEPSEKEIQLCLQMFSQQFVRLKNVQRENQLEGNCDNQLTINTISNLLQFLKKRTKPCQRGSVENGENLKVEEVEKKNQILEQLLHEKQEELEKNYHVISSLEDENQKLSSKDNSIKRKKGKGDELIEANKTITQLKREIQVLKNGSPELLRLKNENKKLIESFENEKAKIKKSMDKYKEEQQEKSKKINSLEKQKQVMSSKLSKLENQVFELIKGKKDVETLKKQVKQKQEKSLKMDRQLKNLTNTIAPLLQSKRHELVRNNVNKFIQKNQHDEKFELNIILLQYLLGLLEKEKEGNQKVEKKESRKSEDEGISLKEENENLKQKITNLLLIKDSLVKEIEFLNQKIEDEVSVDEFGSVVEELEDQTMINDELDRVNQQLFEENEKLKEKNVKLKKKISKLKGEQNEVTMKEEMEEQLNQIEKEKNLYFEKMKRINEELSRKVKEYECELSFIENQKDQYKKDVRELQAMMEENQKENKRLKQEQQQNKEKIQELKFENEELQRMIKKFSEKEEYFEELQRNYNILQEKLQQKDVQQKENEQVKVYLENVHLLKHIIKTREQLMKEKEFLHKKLKEFQADLKQKQQIIQEKEYENENLRIEIRSKEIQIEETQKAIKKLKKLIQNQSKQEANNQRDKLQNQLLDYENDLQVRNKQIDELLKRLIRNEMDTDNEKRQKENQLISFIQQLSSYSKENQEDRKRKDLMNKLVDIQYWAIQQMKKRPSMGKEKQIQVSEEKSKLRKILQIINKLKDEVGKEKEETEEQLLVLRQALKDQNKKINEQEEILYLKSQELQRAQNTVMTLAQSNKKYVTVINTCSEMENALRNQVISLKNKFEKSTAQLSSQSHSEKEKLKYLERENQEKKKLIQFLQNQLEERQNNQKGKEKTNEEFFKNKTYHKLSNKFDFIFKEQEDKHLSQTQIKDEPMKLQQRLNLMQLKTTKKPNKKLINDDESLDDNSDECRSNSSHNSYEEIELQMIKRINCQVADLVQMNRKYQSQIFLLENYTNKLNRSNSNIVSYFVFLRQKMEELIRFLVNQQYIESGEQYLEATNKFNVHIAKINDSEYFESWLSLMKNLFVEVHRKQNQEKRNGNKKIEQSSEKESSESLLVTDEHLVDN